jgi:hypothetical protein
MNCQSTPLFVPLLSAWFSCALSPPDTNQGKARLRSPLLHGESGDAPVPNAFDPYCMGHHLCWHCLRPPLSKLFAGIPFPSPLQYGVAGTPSCLINAKPIAKASPTFFLPLQSVCCHNSDVPKISYALQAGADCSTLHALFQHRAKTTAYIYMLRTTNPVASARSYSFSTVPTWSELRTVMKEKRYWFVSQGSSVGLRGRVPAS